MHAVPPPPTYSPKLCNVPLFFSSPSIDWFKGELGFFDRYVIPLAKKLKECGVFGVSSDEYLNYAENNRREWEDKGKQIVSDMVEKFYNLRTLRQLDWIRTEGGKLI